MSNTPNDGPAFPKLAYMAAPDGSGDSIAVYADDGMTLRDFFAAKAMAQLIAHKEAVIASNPHIRDSAVDIEECVAKAAYFQADAMLRVREESQCPDKPAA